MAISWQSKEAWRPAIPYQQLPPATDKERAGDTQRQVISSSHWIVGGL